MIASSEQVTGAINKAAKPVFELLSKEECPPDTRQAMRNAGYSNEAIERIMTEPRNEEDAAIFESCEITLSMFNLTVGILLGSILERYLATRTATISPFGFVSATDKIMQQKSVEDVINLIWKSK